MTTFVIHAVCTATGVPQEAVPDLLTSPDGGICDIVYDEDAAAPFMTPAALAERGENILARYLPLLPLPADPRPWPTLDFRRTPLASFPALAARLGLRGMAVKDDGRLPTGSFKDRASSVAVLKAFEAGANRIACASTGNAASSLAGWAAHLGMPVTIFVPVNAPAGKVAQLQAFGAQVLLVDGDYLATYETAAAAIAHFGWYNRNAAVNPYCVEGKKTCGLELGEQLGRAGADWVSVSVGDGCTVAGIWKGLRHMHRLGHLGRLPRLLATQAEGAAPLAAAFAEGTEELPAQSWPGTTADSIDVAVPRNAGKALRAVRESSGRFVTVSDAEIGAAQVELASATGIFAEPAGAAGFAGIRRARDEGIVAADETVVHVVTGNGLKDVGAVTRTLGPAPVVAPTLDAVREALRC